MISVRHLKITVVAAGGEYRQEWCVKEDEPIFRIEKFIIQEKSSSLTDAQWRQIARARLGYVILEKVILNRHEPIRIQDFHNSNEKYVSTRMCMRQLRFYLSGRSTVERKILPVSGLLRAHVEDIQHGRLKLRVVWHGRKDMEIVNSKRAKHQ
jgi:hypothetical protein